MPSKINWTFMTSNSTEEREHIEDFWLGLGKEERKNLVKIEKDTILKKMKEQQKYACGCAVCGRKWSAVGGVLMQLLRELEDEEKVAEEAEKRDVYSSSQYTDDRHPFSQDMDDEHSSHAPGDDLFHRIIDRQICKKIFLETLMDQPDYLQMLVNLAFTIQHSQIDQ
ncbi:salt tolerance down-regulator-domain-containing protein [Cyathus striatus]|nr:salt tolerance down-regulator-domain-containing protein [Cyathus striatus]